ncbi:hypothetical protein GPECTOR_5g115 [Gonium pectorale]|uniref:Large ribosomal subunit protein mL45 n=1 Tax=Gonium pectorale TaxID=33097 RepID=A0A150GW24_GONPE|nr:hypothetical protein GPECTOR_5g115 [Gonium pectorale]|eukprot:KXZ54004.1 hypothetical protein GPECTOR_5g115 [Gonium pectorale]
MQPLRWPGSETAAPRTVRFDYRKFVYPDLYDPNESLLCNRYKSHGVVIERYQQPQPLKHWNVLADPELERRMKHFYQRLSTSVLCRRSVWGYSKPALQTRILDAYRNVNQALASGNLKLAEPFVSEQMLPRLAGEVSRRGRVAVKWEMVDPQPQPGDVQLVLGGVVQNPLKQGRLHFVQWTARIASRQRVAVYDSKGSVIAGDPDKVLDVVDYWVFERPILKALAVPRPGPQGADWRLVERL